ncbi:MAG: hypothetical protein HKN45_07790 [Flavobacteriales bacterium]|nr:hypothetical protein [Flavobacteriales bacterium]
MSDSLRQTFYGILIGIIGNVVGFFIFGLGIALTQDISFSYFLNKMFLETDIFRSQVLTGAILVNVVLFYLFMRKGHDGINRGIIITILLTVIAIVYYYK